jgi:hypothetical protein
MTYKNIFLSILLVPLTAMGSSTTDTQIQQLKKKFLQKELELSDLGAMIEEKNELLLSFKTDVQYLLGTLRDKKVLQIEEKTGKLLSQEEKTKLWVELRSDAIDFVYTFCADYENQKSITDVLVKGLIHENSDDVEFESLSFYLIRCAFERPLLIHLIAEYENCLQELRAIENEITTLNA